MMDPFELSRIRSVVGRIVFPSLTFEVSQEGPNVFLRVVSAWPALDNVTGEALTTSWKGRHWRLSQWMTDGEIVQTALKAVLTALEHEAREVFTYQGMAVFDGHYDIDALVALRASGDAIKGRS